MWKMNHTESLVCIVFLIMLLIVLLFNPNSGVADVIGRKFGSQKLPYNSNKSIAGSVAMLTAGFIASVG